MNETPYGQKQDDHCKSHLQLLNFINTNGEDAKFTQGNHELQEFVVNYSMMEEHI